MCKNLANLAAVQYSYSTQMHFNSVLKGKKGSHDTMLTPVSVKYYFNGPNDD